MVLRHAQAVNEGRISQVLCGQGSGQFLHLYAISVNEGRISQVLWALRKPISHESMRPVNLGRISQVLWVDITKIDPPDLVAPSTKDGFLRYCGFSAPPVTSSSPNPSTKDGFLRYCGTNDPYLGDRCRGTVNVGRISQVLWEPMRSNWLLIS